MKHLSEEQIVLHYYGDADGADEIARHLEGCPDCRRAYEHVQSLLKQIAPTEVPEPLPVFEDKMWLNLRDRLPRQEHGFFRQFAPQWALVGVMAALLVGAFLAGRWWPSKGPEIARQPQVQKSANAAPERVVLVAVGRHLERSQMLLVELMNGDMKGRTDISSEQAQARDLLDANYLYQTSAQHSGDPQVAHVLDDLGRVLAELANGPSEVTEADLKSVRERIQSQGLLFKIRVINSEVGPKTRRTAPPSDATNPRSII